MKKPVEKVSAVPVYDRFIMRLVDDPERERELELLNEIYFRCIEARTDDLKTIKLACEMTIPQEKGVYDDWLV